MTAFILRRLGTLVPMLLAVTLLVFALMSLAPGDFLTPVKAQRDINPALIEKAITKKTKALYNQSLNVNTNAGLISE